MPHGDAHWQYLDGTLEPDEACRDYGADGDANCDYGGEFGGLTGRVTEHGFRPVQNDQTQGSARAPEDRGDGQGNLSQWVAPELPEASPEVAQDVRDGLAGGGLRSAANRGI